MRNFGCQFRPTTIGVAKVQTYDAVRDLLVDEFDVNRRNIEGSLTLKELGLDSVAQIDLAMRLEEVFEVDVTDDEVLTASTLVGVVTLVEDKQTSAA
ncbi:acyl carrier protein [Amycolatopsis alba]|uniref:acyl carrier protein n=1 Tax=Amycolatopsis alba TaxID=76020 RepID=UPI001427D153|nr:acyl carrier protein [Amycolatopsis alba]